MRQGEIDMSIKTEIMSDSMSDCTRGSSLEGREDLQELAVSLGLSSVFMLAQDRFKVDRKRLEKLMFGNPDAPETCADFFNNIMKDTKTRIVWPSRLKQGAKSKKDPHIRIFGKAENVQEARNKITAVLDSKTNRVTLKVDVSYTDHSHIIGKGGLTIKRVMEETKCHIHFPDSNRTSQTEKSNQVSIAGHVTGVEQARARVRELTPLMFCFDLPILGTLMMTPDPSSPFIKNLEESHNVRVMFRSRQKLNSTMVVVKGCEWEVDKVKEATQILINHMCASLASQVVVHMMVEISPLHHSIVLGRNNENLKGIMCRTTTQIIFLDPNDPNIPTLKKSNVTISGAINNVYNARQQLIGSLPVVLMFDVPESTPVDMEKINSIMNELDVCITTRNKSKQNILTFVIKGVERNVANIYEARRQLIAPDESPVEVSIPPSYLIPNPGPIFKRQSLGAFNIPSPTLVNPPFGHEGPLWGHSPVSSPLNYQNPLTSHHIQSLVPQAYPSDHLGHFSYSSLSLPELPVHSSLSSKASTVSSSGASPRTISPLLTDISCGDVNRYLVKRETKKAPGFDRPVLTPSSLKQMKLEAFQAMEKPPKPTELRIPNATWSGYGLSHSDYVVTPQESKIDEDPVQDLWKKCRDDDFPSSLNDFAGGPETFLPSSNYMDSYTSKTVASLTSSSPNNLVSLLASNGLEKYIPIFNSHEIDMTTFRTLTEEDLKEMGVEALGARRKMLVCIAELNRRKSLFKGSAAPGAERKNLPQHYNFKK